mmetsp:Transcript_122270/g.228380  ORF Transcript_122270/g.228380 Transcript_122270/m.228380 type:complete len:869 (-) Transcript_122270:152-2758(-)
MRASFGQLEFCRTLSSQESTRSRSNFSSKYAPLLPKVIWEHPCKMCQSHTKLNVLSDLECPPSPTVGWWKMGLCESCHKTCAEQECILCTKSSTDGFSGVCGQCMKKWPQCKACTKRLQVKEIRFKTGLCDECYNSCTRECLECKKNISLGELGWRTGLCNACWDQLKRSCRLCTKQIHGEESTFGTGMCNACSDKQKRETLSCGSTRCQRAKSKTHRKSGLCDDCHVHCRERCALCLLSIPEDEKRWTAGICDACYEAAEKICQTCKRRIPLQQIRWGSGICDDCYALSKKTCRICTIDLTTSEHTYHGVRLCNKCHEQLEQSLRSCKSCGVPCDAGSAYWNTSLCNKCFEDPTIQPGFGRPRSFSEDLASTKDMDQLTASGRLQAKVYSAKVKAYARLFFVGVPQEASMCKFLRTGSLFFAFGMSGWFSANVVFGSQPLLVEAEGERVGSIINACTSVGSLLCVIWFMVEMTQDADEKVMVDSSEVSSYVVKLRNNRKARKKRLQSCLLLHSGQCAAFLSLMLVALAWLHNPGLGSVIVLAVVTGLVGHMADIIVWPIAMQYDGWYTKILMVGASFSGLSANVLVAVLGGYGVSVYFVLTSILQFLMWLVVWRLAGTPKITTPLTDFLGVGHCVCTGCPGCKVAEDVSLASSGAKMPAMGKIAPAHTLENEVAEVELSCLQRATCLLQKAAKICNLQKDLEEKRVFLSFQIGAFILKAVRYSVPSLFPFMANMYGHGSPGILQAMLTMYNAGDVMGRAFPPRTLKSLLLCGFSLCLTATVILLCTMFPEVFSEFVPYDMGKWVLPVLILIFNLSTGSFTSGLYMQARSYTSSPDELQASMSFLGQFGVALGNLVVFLCINVLHLLP